MVRWTLALLDNSESYVMELNPNAAGNALANRAVEWTSSRLGYTGTRSGRTPQPWEFSGVLRSQAQFEAMVLWLNKRKKVRVTTDLGQQYVVRLVSFVPDQSRSRVQAPHRHTYTVNCLIT